MHVGPAAPVLVRARTRCSRPAATQELDVEKSPEAAVRHRADGATARGVLLQPIHRGVRATHFLPVDAPPQPIRPLDEADRVPHLDGKSYGQRRWIDRDLA